ncbi:MAG: VWA domain-containing protein [Gemmatimonadetes bacterium]|nr:VWA domain-containing protein [Gemmatimonadota bacterium]
MNAAIDFPWLALLAVLTGPAIGGLYLWHHRRRLRRLGELGGDAAIERLTPAVARQRPVRTLTRVGAAASLAVIALAGPRWGDGTVVGRQRGVDVVIAMDASVSMQAEDERPSRLERMRQEVRRYRAAAPGDRNALIAFAGRSYVLAPLTLDNGAIELFLDNFDPSIVGFAGTALAPTITQGTELLKAASGSASRVLLILSDGEAFDDHDAAIAAAQEAKAAGISIVAVGFGTEDGGTIPVFENGEMRELRDDAGEVVTTRYDPTLLKRVADAAGGEFIGAGESDRAGRIQRALSRLDAEQRNVEENLSRPLRLGWFLIPAILLLLVDAWRADGGEAARLRRWLRWAVPVFALTILPTTPGAVAAVAAPVLLVPRAAAAQSPVKLHEQGRYTEAAAKWRRAIEQGDKRMVTLYDLGTALLNADSLNTAEDALDRAQATPETAVRRRALFNLGLTRLKRAMRPDNPERARAAEGALAAYRQLLMETPGDDDARWNYEIALKIKQSGSGGGSREQPRQQPQESQQASPQENQPMSRQQAEQLLAAASRDERDTQARKQANTRMQRPPGGKAW